jgi:hypothetical protein
MGGGGELRANQGRAEGGGVKPEPKAELVRPKPKAEAVKPEPKAELVRPDPRQSR